MTAPERLLVVEDEELIGEMLRLNLEDEGYLVTWLQDGLGLERELAAHDYAALVLDVMLPTRDGFTLARAVRAAGYRLPILMLTSLGDVDSKVNGLDSGADDYLTKPFEMGEFLARLRALRRRAPR